MGLASKIHALLHDSHLAGILGKLIKNRTTDPGKKGCQGTQSSKEQGLWPHSLPIEGQGSTLTASNDSVCSLHCTREGTETQRGSDSKAYPGPHVP